MSKKEETCFNCNGRKKIYARNVVTGVNELIDCPVCFGKGKITIPDESTSLDGDIEF